MGGILALGNVFGSRTRQAILVGRITRISEPQLRSLSVVKSFEELLFEGVMNAFRTLSLEQLTHYRDGLDDMNLPKDIGEFPRIVLNLAIAEKQNLRAMN